MNDLLENEKPNNAIAHPNTLPPAEVPQNMLSAIVMLAKDPSVDVSKLGALVEMQERMEMRQAEREFNAAFVRLAPKLPRIKKNGNLEYPINKNDPDGPKRLIAKFAKFEDIDEAIRPIANEEGFVYSFNTTPRQGDGGGLLVTCILRHAGGHSTETSIPVPLDSSGGKNNLQGYGSTLSYGKRYTLCAALNIVAEGEDDDGKAGGAQYATDDQIREIEALIAQTRSDRAKFLRLFGLSDIMKMEAGAYVAAKNMLAAKAQPKGDQ